MIEFLVDQNFNEHIVDGLTRLDATLEFTYVRDVGLASGPDPMVLESAAARDLVLLTHDRTTVPAFSPCSSERRLTDARRILSKRRHANRSGHRPSPYSCSLSVEGGMQVSCLVFPDVITSSL